MTDREESKTYDWLVEEEQGKQVFYVVKNLNTVIATCYVKNHAVKISILLNFLEKKKQNKKLEKQILNELVV